MQIHDRNSNIRDRRAVSSRYYLQGGAVFAEWAVFGDIQVSPQTDFAWSGLRVTPLVGMDHELTIKYDIDNSLVELVFSRCTHRVVIDLIR